MSNEKENPDKDIEETKKEEPEKSPEPAVMPPELDVALESYDSDEALKNLGIKTEY